MDFGCFCRASRVIFIVILDFIYTGPSLLPMYYCMLSGTLLTAGSYGTVYGGQDRRSLEECMEEVGNEEHGHRESMEARIPLERQISQQFPQILTPSHEVHDLAADVDDAVTEVLGELFSW